MKFADDMVVVGLNTHNNESECRQEVEKLEVWYKVNNLSINVKKTKEMTVDFTKTGTTPLPLHITAAAVEVVSSCNYLRVHISDSLE